MRSLPDGIGNVALLLVATAVCLGSVEVGLRIHYTLNRTALLRDVAAERDVPPRGSTVALADMIQPSPHERLVFELRPNLDVHYMGARVRTNSRGWRGPEYRHEKPPGTIRIVGIGDSVMFGWAVQEEERYTNRLGSLLKRRYPHRDWQILTLACPGYNLVMELEALERYGLDYDPDLIVYGYVANDTCLPNFVAEDADVFGHRSFLLSYIANLSLPSPRLIGRNAVIREDAVAADFAAKFCTPESVPATYRALVCEENFQRALNRLGSLGVEREISVVLVAHPLRPEFDWPDVPSGMRIVYGTAMPGQPGSVTPLPELRVGRLDPHPNAAGHDVIARNIFEELAAEGIWDDLLAREHSRGG